MHRKIVFVRNHNRLQHGCYRNLLPFFPKRYSVDYIIFIKYCLKSSTFLHSLTKLENSDSNDSQDNMRNSNTTSINQNNNRQQSQKKKEKKNRVLVIPKFLVLTNL